MGLRLSVRLFGLVGTTLLLASALLAYYVSHLRRITLEYSSAWTASVALANDAHALRSALERQVATWKEIARLRGHTRRETAGYSEEFARRSGEVSELSNSLFRATPDAQLRKEIERFRIAHQEFEKGVEERTVVRFRFRGRRVYRVEGPPAGQSRSLTILAAQIVSAVDKQMENLASRQQHNLAHQGTVAMQIGLPAAFVILVATIVVIMSANHSGRELSDALARSAEGDLNHPISDRAARALGSSGKRFNEFMESFGKCIRDVVTGTDRLARTIDQISSSVARQTEVARTQRNHAGKAIRAMQGISPNYVQLSGDSARAAEAARKGSEAARQSRATITGMFSEMNEFVAAADEIVKKMESIGNVPDRINQATGIVGEVANQVSLLAVNAEVEAAHDDKLNSRARPLADRMRDLEKRTLKATKDISAMVESVREGTKASAAAVTKGTKNLHESLAAATKSGLSLQEIVQSAEQVFDDAMRIPASVAAQLSAMEEMKSCVEEMENAGLLASEDGSQSAFACHELSEALADLQGVLRRFRVPRGADVSTVRARRLRTSAVGDVQPTREEVVPSGKTVIGETDRETNSVLARRSVAASLA